MEEKPTKTTTKIECETLIDSSQVNDAEATEPQWVPIAELKPGDFNNFGERVLHCIRMVAETEKKPDSADTRGGKGHSIK